MKIGILPLGRPTFDLGFAEETLAAMLAALDATTHQVVGPRALLLDAEATRTAMADLAGAGLDRLLILQVTFTDASMVVAAAGLGLPLAIWAPPEPRLGGRLRLNAFCGLNLAAHALGRAGQSYRWLYAAPTEGVAERLSTLLQGDQPVACPFAEIPRERSPEGARVAATLKGQRIGRIGEHPEGFDTCAYSPEALAELVGVTVEPMPLEALFETARAVPEPEAAVLLHEVDQQVSGLDTVDAGQLDRSLRLKAGLAAIRERGGFDAFAIRCWPETFTRYGGAVCSPAAMMGEAGVPCACEADVYGALTQLVLRAAARDAVFLTDLVDIDTADETAVVWHCGQAPLSMRDPEVRASATVHSNRGQPLLFEFPLKPGPVTLLRISQARGETSMVLGRAEMLRRPMAFTGTSGVLRFERPAAAVMEDILNCGLEHHLALAYGDHRATLRAAAAELQLPVLEI